MSALALLIVAAHATVIVEDDPCLKAEPVTLEVQTWVADELLDRSVLRVGIERAGRAWTLKLEARSLTDELLWTHEHATAPEQCEHLPLAIARIAQQKYAGVPSWGLDPKDPAAPHLVVELAATAPDAFHFGFGAGLGLPVSQRVRWFTHMEGYFANPVFLGEDRLGSGEPRRGQFVGVLWGTGLDLDLSQSENAKVQGRAWVSLGPHLAYGRDFDRNFQAWRPRALASAQVDWVSPFQLRLGARLQVPFVRLATSGTGIEVTEVAEPWVRLGLVVGIEAPLKRE